MLEETKKKISQTMKGKKPKNLELLHKIPWTEERKRKVGLANSIALKGKKQSDEIKRKL